MALIVAAFVLGACVGAIVTDWAGGKMFERVARFQRTGRPVVSGGASPTFVPGGEMKLDPASMPGVERTDADAAFDRVVDRGAETFMRLEPALSRDQAKAKARRALEETGSFSPLGGVPSA